MIKRFLEIKKRYKDWDDFMSTVNFYRCNPTRIVFISQLLCKLGRHDYEFISIKDNWSLLECFYCGRQKSSYHNS